MTSRARQPSRSARPVDPAPQVPVDAAPVDATPAEVPRPVRIAALVIVLEALALAAIGGLELVKSATGQPQSLFYAVIQALMALGSGAVLALLAWSLVRLRRWARTPTAVLQLLALPVAWGLYQGRLWLIGTAVALPALVVLGLLATRPARVVFYHEGYGS